MVIIRTTWPKLDAFHPTGSDLISYNQLAIAVSMPTVFVMYLSLGAIEVHMDIVQSL